MSHVPWPLLHVSILINALFLISLHWLCMRMDEVRALVHVLCNNSVSRVPWPLSHASMQINVLLCSGFHCIGYARA